MSGVVAASVVPGVVASVVPGVVASVVPGVVASVVPSRRSSREKTCVSAILVITCWGTISSYAPNVR